MVKELKKTTKGRLSGEYKTGASYKEIAKRLNDEGMGRQVSGGVKPWDTATVSAALCGMGLRKKKRQAKRKTHKPRTVQPATRIAKPDVMRAVKSLLAIEAMPADERIALALLAIG